jgi:hypothetical protein
VIKIKIFIPDRGNCWHFLAPSFWPLFRLRRLWRAYSGSRV